MLAAHCPRPTALLSDPAAAAPPGALLQPARRPYLPPSPNPQLDEAVKPGHTATMRVISAVLLAVLGGNANPSAADVKKILGSVGVEAPEADVARLLKELEGKDINELIAAGREKLQSVPSGGGGAAAAAPAAGGGGGGGAAAAAAPAKKDEPSEEDEDMGFSLFD